MTNKLLKHVEQDHLKKDIPQFRVGDTVDVHTRIIEGEKERIQVFGAAGYSRDYEIEMTCPEFTSLCPLGGVESDAADLELLKGGAPDFGTIIITYVPGDVCIELKSLKLYLWSFRNDGIFYERAVNRILDDLAACCQPRWMEVVGDFNVRGGIKSVIRARVGNRTGSRA